MSQLFFLSHIARSFPGVTASRLRRGPARPSWSFGFELFTNALRSTSLAYALRSWPDQRRAFDAMANTRSPGLRGVRRREVDAGGIPGEWFVPKGASEAKDAPTILFFHGGAYAFGSTRSHAALIARIATASGVRVLAPNYRLAPEHPFPAANDDAMRVHAWLTRDVAPAKIVLSGDSAGGGLSLALMLRLRDANEAQPAGAALICPWVDLAADSGSVLVHEAWDWGKHAVAQKWAKAYLGDRDPKDPYASPAHADLAGLPPLLVQVGDAELLRDQCLAFADRAKTAGVDVTLELADDMVHDWHTFSDLFKRCREPIARIGAFVRARLA